MEKNLRDKKWTVLFIFVNKCQARNIVSFQFKMLTKKETDKGFCPTKKVKELRQKVGICNMHVMYQKTDQ